MRTVILPPWVINAAEDIQAYHRLKTVTKNIPTILDLAAIIFNAYKCREQHKPYEMNPSPLDDRDDV